MKQIYFYDTPIGKIGLVEKEETIVRLLLPGEPYEEEAVFIETPFLKQVYQELLEYFSKERTTFTVPCSFAGTQFQVDVWNALTTISYGEVVSYQEIARLVGSKNAARAVGMANHHNPIPIIIPCHRVVGADGSLVGYGGGLALKIKLLELEGIKVQENRISCSNK